MNKIFFKIEDDVVIRYIPMPEAGENIYKTEVVMTKEIFQECYKRWIKPVESEDNSDVPDIHDGKMEGKDE